jgi:hypothetical protein
LGWIGGCPLSSILIFRRWLVFVCCIGSGCRESRQTLVFPGNTELDVGGLFEIKHFWEDITGIMHIVVELQWIRRWITHGGVFESDLHYLRVFGAVFDNFTWLRVSTLTVKPQNLSDKRPEATVILRQDCPSRERCAARPESNDSIGGST